MSIAMQSLTASTSSACAAPGAAVDRRKAVEARAHGTEAGAEVGPPKGRHALMAALTGALDGIVAVPAGDAASGPDESPSGERESKHALHAFVHELFAALRPSESEGRPGRGFAWGRTSSVDLAQRLDAVVQRLQGAAPSPPASAVVASPEVEAGSGDAPAAPSTSASTAPDDAHAMPAADAAATPATTIGADPLLAAFQQLLASRDPAADGGDGSDALIAFLQRMSQALAGDAASEPPAAGTLLDVTA